MGGCPVKQIPIHQLHIKGLLLGTLFVSPLTSCICHFTPGERVGSSWKIHMRRERERSKRVVSEKTGLGGFFFNTKGSARERGREIECLEREGSTREKERGFTELERAAPARRWGIHGRFVLVCGRLAIKRSWRGEGAGPGWGQATDCRCLYWRGLLVKK